MKIERLKEIKVRRQGYCLCVCELSIMSVEKGIKLKKKKADDAVDILKDRCSVAVVVMSETAVKIIKTG